VIFAIGVGIGFAAIVLALYGAVRFVITDRRWR